MFKHRNHDGQAEQARFSLAYMQGASGDRHSSAAAVETLLRNTLKGESRSPQSTLSSMSYQSFEIDTSDPTYQEFASVFQSFQERAENGEVVLDEGPKKGEVYYSDEDEEDEDQYNARKAGQENDGMTRRQRRQAAVCHRCPHTEYGAYHRNSRLPS